VSPVTGRHLRRRRSRRRRAAGRPRRLLPGTSAGQGQDPQTRPDHSSPSRLAEFPPEGFAAELAAFLRERADHLVSEARSSLRQAHLEHYEKDGLPAMGRRLTALVDVTVSCLACGDAGPIVDHTTRIARKRFAAGYDLLEVQTSINVIEEALWSRILSSLPLQQQAHALGLVSGLLGLGKDSLARTYVALAREQARAVDQEEVELDRSS
jgi:hypothetical protein